MNQLQQEIPKKSLKEQLKELLGIHKIKFSGLRERMGLKKFSNKILRGELDNIQTDIKTMRDIVDKL